MRTACPNDYAAKLQPLAASYYRTLHFSIPDPRHLSGLVETMVLEAYNRLIENTDCDIELLDVDIDTDAVLSTPMADDAVKLTWGYTGVKFQGETGIVNGVFVGHRYNKDHYVKRLSSQHMAVVTVRDKEIDAGVYLLQDVDTHHPLAWAFTRAEALATAVN